MTKKQFNWGPGLFIIGYHLLLLLSLPFYFYYSPPSLGMVLVSLVIFFMTGMSITGGYHRFYSHRTYKAHPLVESCLLFLATMAAQGSALRWAFDHRNHHAHVDTDKDPYSIKKGFWYAHILWLFEKPQDIEEKTVPDLIRNRLVMFQHRYYPWLMIGTNLGVTAFVGWLLNDYVGAFFFAFLTRLFFLHHCTWFINSLAHTWGEKPFCQEQSAVDNYFLSILTFGEGYHNYHHTFANDYRNGIRWFHFDPTKWLIWTLQKLRLAKSLKRTSETLIKKRMVIERKSFILEQLKERWHTKKEELEKMAHDLSERIVENIATFHQLTEKYATFKKECREKNLLKELHEEIKSLKKRIRDDYRMLKQLSRNVMRLENAKC